MLIVMFRTLILYLLVVIVLRIMGKPQIGQLQPFELVIAIMISELAAVPMADTEIPLINGIIPILTLLLAQVTLSYWSLKSERARRIICGKPSLVIEKGRILENELRRLRMTVNDLLEQLRVKNYPDINEVNYAILETNGDLSVIPKAQNRSVQLKDLGINASDPGLPLTLVIDGIPDKKNLEKVNLSIEHLLEMLDDKGLHSIQDLFFASIDVAGKIYWQRKEEIK